jgi:hypothetical protein
VKVAEDFPVLVAVVHDEQFTACFARAARHRAGRFFRGSRRLIVTR